MGLTSSSRGKKIRKKKQRKKKTLCSVLPFLRGQTSQRSCVENSPGQRGLRKECIFSPRMLGMHKGKEAGKDGRVCCQAKQGLCSSGTGVNPWVDRVWGQGVSATDMHQGAGWVRGEPSIPAVWKADAQGLPDPPSQLSAEEEEKKRERLVPELTRVAGAFTLWHVLQPGGRGHPAYPP